MEACLELFVGPQLSEPEPAFWCRCFSLLAASASNKGHELPRGVMGRTLDKHDLRTIFQHLQKHCDPERCHRRAIRRRPRLGDGS